MAKEKVTLTLDAGNLAALRSLVGPRSLSAAIDAALAERVTRLRHLAAVDDWLAELDATHGPVPPETLEWAARLVDEWDSKPRRQTGRLMLLLDSEAVSAIAHGPPVRRDRVTIASIQP